MLIWLRGLVTRRLAQLASTAAGIAIAVGLLASIGTFVSASKATMTRRAVSDVAVDWQVEARSGADPATIGAAVSGFPGVEASAPVNFARTTSFEVTSDATTQTTGPGVVVGLPSTYHSTFPGELRDLTGSSSGVLLAQQTAANLHARPGDLVTIGRAGLSAVQLRVDGVVDLPFADSLFQTVGAPSGAQPQAPPDNVLLVADTTWHQLFDPLAVSRPDLVRCQIHVRLTHRLPADPASAYTKVTGLARNLEVKLAGAGLVGDNLGATLAAARSDALYAQVLFVFLGMPGTVLAAILTAAVSAAAATRRRREQALLRTRGATTPQLVRLALVETALVGVTGVAAGLGLALAVGHLAFGSHGFGATTSATAWWAGGAAAAGLAIAAAVIALPAWRDASAITVTNARRTVTRPAANPRWARYGLDFALLGVGALVFWLTSRNGYALVFAAEGVATVSVSYWAFLGPGLLWAGAGLLTWRLTNVVLRRGRRPLARIFTPLAGGLADTVAASLARQRRTQARAVSVLALTIGFAVSTAVFNATYRQQADVDARLTNGADLTVTQSPGATVPASAGAALAAVPGVRHVEAIQHRFAYVGADLQDLFGVNPATIVAATRLQNAYFTGGTARQLMSRLASQPDGILVSAETVKDFQLQQGDRLTLRLQDGRTKALTDVQFHYLGIAKEFPTAPKDSFLIANANYVARATSSDAVGAFLVDTGGTGISRITGLLQARVGVSATVTSITAARNRVGSTLTAVDLAGLTKVELGFALALAAAASGLVLWLGLSERRRTFAIATALGARPRQLGGFVWSETGFVTVAGTITGAITAWLLSEMLVAVLTGVFDPPPETLAVPWRYLVLVGAILVAATVTAALFAIRTSRRPALELLREL